MFLFVGCLKVMVLITIKITVFNLGEVHRTVTRDPRDEWFESRRRQFKEANGRNQRLIDNIGPNNQVSDRFYSSLKYQTFCSSYAFY